jgi:hypothetical protein
LRELPKFRRLRLWRNLDRTKRSVGFAKRVFASRCDSGRRGSRRSETLAKLVVFPRSRLRGSTCSETNGFVKSFSCMAHSANYYNKRSYKDSLQAVGLGRNT